VSVASSERIEGIIFDLDGTLYHLTMSRILLSFRLWRSIPLLRQYGAARAALRGRTFPDAPSLADAFARELGRRANIAPDEAARWFDQVFFEEFIALLRRRARPRVGLLDLLGKLRAVGVKLAVVSDLSRVDDRLRALGLPPEKFDVLMCSEGCGELKPSPRAFLTAAQQLGLDPSTMLVVGDRVDLDGHAAQAAKMDYLIIDNRPRLVRRLAARDRHVAWPEVVEAIAARTGLRPT
jgi:HAD superfamily hydrolase (TIGR01549 family)